MLNLSFISIHPEFIESYFKFGVFKSAISTDLAKIKAINLREHTQLKRGQVDDRPYGGGDGMVLRPEPMASAIKSIDPKPYVINLAPGGKKFSQQDAQRLLNLERPLAFTCGRFAGLDQRCIDLYVDEELSLGDFIISGGELASLSIADAILRLIPGVLGHSDSSHFDSFSPGFEGQLEHPIYTRPEVFEGLKVPAVLTSGDHKKIEAWQKEKSREQTLKLRPKLIKDHQ